MASLGQFRYAPSGRVVGIGFDTALKIAEVRGYHPAVVSILLQDAELAIIQSMNTSPEDFADHGRHHP